MIITGNPDRAMTVREWDPVLQLKGYTLIGIWTHPFNLEALGGPVGPAPSPVTALSTGEGCFASSWLKFLVSPTPATLPHSRKKLSHF